MASQKITMRLPPLPTVRDLVRLYRLRALKQLSQNFLMDERLINKIVGAAGNILNGQVCEVGPGPGGISRSILNRRPQRLVLIEKDRRFVPVLELLADASNGTTEIVIGDVMNFNMEALFPNEHHRPWDAAPPNIHLIGNLPFSISTPLIIQWLKAISERSSAWVSGRVRMTLTFQKEVAQRIVAPVTSQQRCRMSVMCQNWCLVEHKFTIPGAAFVPKPDVDVGVVHFVPRVQPVISLPFQLVEKVVRNIFNSRQKYSIRGAEMLFPQPIREVMGQEMYKLADMDPTIRPFHLSIEEIGRLCSSYQHICERDPRLYKYNCRATTKRLENKLFEDEVVDSYTNLNSVSSC